MPDDKKTSTTYIKNYGLFWRRDDVVWGSKENTGTLLGKEHNTDKSRSINFRTQIGFYALYDKQHELIYVGQVGGRNHTSDSIDNTIYTRLKAHNESPKLRDRWAYFSWFGIKRVITKDKKKILTSDSTKNPQGGIDTFLKQVEAIVIEVAEPSRNKQGGAFRGAKEYFQHKDK